LIASSVIDKHLSQ